MRTVVSRPRPAVVTGRKLAGSSPAAVRSVYKLDPREGIREVVAQLASEHSRDELMAVPISLRERVNQQSLSGYLYQMLYSSLAISSHHSIALPIAVNRIHSPDLPGYPLRRTYLITVNLDSDGALAEIREVSAIIPLRGRGADVDLALRDLARCFDRIVRENHFIPPHVRNQASNRIDAILNHMVDWEQYEQENPVLQPFWGRVTRRTARGLTIAWLTGPAGIRDTTGFLPKKDVPLSLARMSDGQWFYGTAKCYPDRLEWVEDPHAVPDPSDPEARRQLWDSLPKVAADEPGCWPVKGTS